MRTTDTRKRSTNIQSVGYDAATQTLEITFKSGGRYRYHKVTPMEHEKFMDSKSLGRAFNLMFWGNKAHPSQKIERTSGH